MTKAHNAKKLLKQMKLAQTLDESIRNQFSRMSTHAPSRIVITKASGNKKSKRTTMYVKNPLAASNHDHKGKSNMSLSLNKAKPKSITPGEALLKLTVQGKTPDPDLDLSFLQNDFRTSSDFRRHPCQAKAQNKLRTHYDGNSYKPIKRSMLGLPRSLKDYENFVDAREKMAQQKNRASFLQTIREHLVDTKTLRKAFFKKQAQKPERV